MGEDCRPCTTLRPLTLAGSPALPPLRLTGGFCHTDYTVPRQDVNSSFPLLRVPPPGKVFAHTQVRDPILLAIGLKFVLLGISLFVFEGESSFARFPCRDLISVFETKLQLI